MTGPEAALAACRFVHDGAALLLWGAFAYLATLVPRDLGEETARRLGAVRLWAVAAALATTAAVLPIDVAEIGEGWSDVVDPATVRAVVFDTSVGRAWQAQAVAALLLASTVVVPRRARTAATATAAGLLLASVTLTGHGAMHEGGLGIVHRTNAALHVLAAGAWFGALVPLLLILRALDDHARRREAGIALRRFSSVGHAAVALVIATGAANTWLILGRWPSDWSSPYQALLAAKIGLALAMTVLAVLNRYILVPRMGHARDATLRSLRRSTLAELGLGLACIGCVSVFGLLEPR